MSSHEEDKDGSSALPRHTSAGVARKEENEYIPAFISKAPFYLGGDDTDESARDLLQHQRIRKAQNEEAERRAWSENLRAKKVGPARTKWVKGSCENCGAMGHKKKDCLERPRKVGAKFSGRDIQADREVKTLHLGWAAKRDAYNGYDPKDFTKVVEEYNIMEEARRLVQEAERDANGKKRKVGEEEDLEDENGDKDGYEAGFHYAEESDMGRDRATTKQSMRIREDKAKYLLNLDTDSAKYNPKNRTLVDAGAMGDQSAALFAEEEYMRSTGDASAFEQAQRYAWERQEKTGDTRHHPQANPTAGMLLRKKEAEEREAKRRKKAEALATHYGTQEAMPETLKELAGSTQEHFVEYDELGLIKGAPEVNGMSRYAENLFTNNHTSVWGSWWSDFKWGYACCHSFIKNSYCTGYAGRQAKQETEKWDD